MYAICFFSSQKFFPYALNILKVINLCTMIFLLLQLDIKLVEKHVSSPFSDYPYAEPKEMYSSLL